jgi:hypothetical protein
MSTYSLVLRGQIGRRLTIAEMDGNFQYLEEISLSGGGTLNEDFVSIGGGLGNPATGSQNFTFDADKNLIVGNGHTKNNTDNGVILGGLTNSLDGGGEGLFNSSIIGGTLNKICYRSDESSIVGGYENCINDYSCRSSIMGGCCNCIEDSCGSSVIGGRCNEIFTGTNDSSKIGRAHV